MRPAYINEILEWKGQTMPADPFEDGHCYVLDKYMTDCPGYAGPVGIVIWRGSPNWVTIFLKRDGKWVKDLDSVQFLEADPRGAFELFQSILENGDSSLFEFISEEDNRVEEFWDTGSLTVELAGRKWEIVINVKEVGSG